MLAAALALGAQEAKAQPVFQCPAASPPVTAVFPPGFDLSLLTADHLRAVFRAAGPIFIPTEPVDCGFVNHDGTRNVVVRNPRITVNEDLYAGISAWRQGGNGDLVVYVHGVDAAGEPQHFHPIDHGRYAVRTMGDGEWNVGEESYGVWASHTGRGRVAIDFRDLSLSTAGGDAAHGIYATQQGSYFYENEKTHRSRGAVIVNVIETERDREGRVRPLVGTRGDESDAIRAEYTRAAAKGHIAVTVKGYTIATGGIVPPGPRFPNNQGVPGVEPGPLLPSLNGYESRGIHARHEGLGDIRIAVTDSHILTWGIGAHGILADHTGRSETITNIDLTTEVRTGGGAIDIDVTGGEIRTAGANSIGIHGWHRGAGDVVIDATGATIATTGEGAHGVLAHIRQATTTEGDRITGTETEVIPGTGEGDVAISVTGGSIATEGDSTFAIWANHENKGDIDISVSGGATVATEGDDAHGVFASQGLRTITRSGTDPTTTVVETKYGGNGDLTLAVAGGATVTTAGEGAHGVFAEHQGVEGDVAVTIEGDSVATEGDDAHGVYASKGIRTTSIRTTTIPPERTEDNPVRTVVETETTYSGSGDLTVTVTGGDIATKGRSSIGVRAVQGGSDALVVEVSGGSVRTTGYQAHGIYAWRPADAEGRISVTVSGGSVLAEGDGAAGVYVTGAGEAEVTVGKDGRVSATASGTGIFSDGPQDFTATVAGHVEGGIHAAGAGDHMVTVEEGGTVTETIRLAASTVAVDGTAGRVWLENGGTVTVGDSGRITGIETGIEGDTGIEAVRSDTGDLTASLAGTLVGDVLALGSGTHRVTVEEGGDVSGTVRVATEVGSAETDSAVKINGAVGRVRVDRGGRLGGLTVGPKGRIRGIDDIAVSSDQGDIYLVLEEHPDEMAGESALRVNGRIVAADGRGRVQVQLRRADGDVEDLGRLGTKGAVPFGAYDVGIDDEGGIRVERDIAPRARVYEALPSVLLGMNGLPEFQDRMAAPRDAKGGWARVEAVDGDWKAEASSTHEKARERSKVDLAYDHHRYGIQVGLDAPVGEDGLLAVSLHHRRGSAKVRNGGDVEPSGIGGGVSGTWRRNDVYVDVQAEATWYETDFSSSIRGPLKDGVKGSGWALGVETGRRVASGMDGVALVPRAGLVHSRVSLDDFVDAVDARMSLEEGRSLKGRLGVGVEMKPHGSPESRLFGSLDVEHEFKDETKVEVSGTELESTAQATWLRLGLNGAHSWNDGRVALQGGVSYAEGGGGNSEIGGALALKVRF